MDISQFEKKIVTEKLLKRGQSAPFYGTWTTEQYNIEGKIGQESEVTCMVHTV